MDKGYVGSTVDAGPALGSRRGVHLGVPPWGPALRFRPGVLARGSRFSGVLFHSMGF